MRAFPGGLWKIDLSFLQAGEQPFCKISTFGSLEIYMGALNVIVTLLFPPLRSSDDLDTMLITIISLIVILDVGCIFPKWNQAGVSGGVRWMTKRSFQFCFRNVLPILTRRQDNISSYWCAANGVSNRAFVVRWRPLSTATGTHARDSRAGIPPNLLVWFGNVLAFTVFEIRIE